MRRNEQTAWRGKIERVRWKKNLERPATIQFLAKERAARAEREASPYDITALVANIIPVFCRCETPSGGYIIDQ